MEVFSHFESRIAYAILLAAVTIVTSICIKIIARPIKNLAPGSYGFPIIGESVNFLRAHMHGKTSEWIQERVDKFGPVFKTSLYGKKTVVLIGQAGNKFTFSSPDLGADQPRHIANLLGKKNIIGLTGTQHKPVRSVMTSLLNLGSIKESVSRMDSEVVQRILQELHGRDSVKMVEVMKKISFKVTGGLLFKLAEGKERDALYEDYKLFANGLSSLPIVIPGTAYYKALEARDRIRKKLSDIMRKIKDDQTENDSDNIITSFLNQRDENDDHFTETAILDNLVTLILASDTTSVLLCSLVSKLGRRRDVYDKVHQEQMEVAKASNERDGKLTWNEIQMMKYTWAVAQELLRLTPPVSNNIRTAARDTTFGGFDIPKGWQVLWLTHPTHLDKDIFEEPEKFDPTRFEGRAKSSLPPLTYIPFGGGAKICPGMEFARMEVLLIMHHLVLNYSWTEIIPNEPVLAEPFRYPAMGLPVKLYRKKQCMLT